MRSFALEIDVNDKGWRVAPNRPVGFLHVLAFQDWKGGKDEPGSRSPRRSTQYCSSLPTNPDAPPTNAPHFLLLDSYANQLASYVELLCYNIRKPLRFLLGKKTLHALLLSILSSYPYPILFLASFQKSGYVGCLSLLC